MTSPSDGAESTAEVPWLSEEEQRAWFSVCHLMLQLPGALDAQLQQDADLNLFEYLVLSRLSMAPDRTLRMSELAVLASGSLSRLSNVIKRLETRGYVRRQIDSHDRRYTNAMLTEAGWDKVVQAAPGHVGAVRRLVFDPLDAAQIAALTAISDQVRTSAAADSAETAGGT